MDGYYLYGRLGEAHPALLHSAEATPDGWLYIMAHYAEQRDRGLYDGLAVFLMGADFIPVRINLEELP